jgi:hypothetical protein
MESRREGSLLSKEEEQGLADEMAAGVDLEGKQEDGMRVEQARDA